MPKRLMRRFYKQAACNEHGKQVINRRPAIKLARQLARHWQETNRKGESINA